MNFSVKAGVALALSFGLSACGSMEQMLRDDLRYGAADRGEETYYLNPDWVPEDKRVTPLEAMDRMSGREMAFYREYIEIELKKLKQMQGAEGDPGRKIAPPVPDGAGGYMPQAGIFWGRNVLDKMASTETVTENGADGKPKTITTRTGPDPAMVRALSGTVSAAQNRDLATEPAYPTLPPVKRTVKLGCLPPPDQAAFEAAGALKVLLPENNGQVSAEYKTAVAKLFEESERTLFLQYAMYRLCEMSVNAPAGMRNVYPLMVLDIVRRTAEMDRQADAHWAKAREAEANMAAEQAKHAKDNAEGAIDLMIAECVKARAPKDAKDDALKAAGQTCREAYRPQAPKAN